MNTIRNIISAFFLGLMLLTSCSSERTAEVITPQPPTEETPVGNISLSLSAQYGEGDDSDDLRAIGLSNADKPKFVLAGSD